MEIQLGSKNEFEFVPDIGNNLELPEQEQFKVVYRKLSNRLHASQWSSFDKEGNFNYNYFDKIKANVIRLVNPPELRFNTGQLKKMTVKDLCNEENHELFGLVEQITNAIEETEKEGIGSKKK